MKNKIINGVYALGRGLGFIVRVFIELARGMWDSIEVEKPKKKKKGVKSAKRKTKKRR